MSGICQPLAAGFSDWFLSWRPWTGGSLCNWWMRLLTVGDSEEQRSLDDYFGSSSTRHTYVCVYIYNIYIHMHLFSKSRFDWRISGQSSQLDSDLSLPKNPLVRPPSWLLAQQATASGCPFPLMKKEGPPLRWMMINGIPVTSPATFSKTGAGRLLWRSLLYRFQIC